MKYYYPTEISNLPTILLAQSIAAPITYLKRPFASTIYHPLLDQYCSDVIYLYQGAVPETIQERLGESDVKKHPVVLELELEDREAGQLILVKHEKYMSVNTIYLNTKQLKFILLNDNDRSFVSKHILPKLPLGSLYQDLFVVKEPPYCELICGEADTAGIDMKAIVAGAKRNLDIDIYYNSIKGLYFGLLLGKPPENQKTLSNINSYVLGMAKQSIATLNNKLLLCTLAALIAYPRHVSPMSLIDIYVKEELLSRIEGLYSLYSGLKKYIKDLKKIDHALKDANYTLQAGDLQSSITLALYIMMVCINSPRDIDAYLRKYSFSNSHLVYVFYATHVGFTGIPSYWYSRSNITELITKYDIEVFSLKLLYEIRNSTGFGKTRYGKTTLEN